MALKIDFKEFSGLFELSGDNQSAVYEKNGKLFLKGSFTLVCNINGKKIETQPITFPLDEIEVRLENQIFFLERTANVHLFALGSTVSLSKNDYSPILYLNTISLSKIAELNISFDDLSLSIFGDVTSPSPKGFYFSSISAALLLTQFPSNGRPGFYIKMIDGNPCVICGSPSSVVKLNQFTGLNCQIKPGSQFLFNLATLALDFVSGLDLHLIQMTEATGWELMSASIGTTFLKVKQFTCVDGWVQSKQFADKDTIISKKHPDRTITAKGLRTKLFTKTENNLAFNYPMEINRNTKLKKKIIHNGMQFFDSPHFVYKGMLEPPTLENLHYGIRIRGLSNVKGASVKLDADLAVIRLEDDGRISLQAGLPIKIKGKLEDSRLLPQKDMQNSGLRLVKIPCIPATLVAKENLADSTSSVFSLDTVKDLLIIHNPELETSPFSPGNKESSSNSTYDKLNWICTEKKIECDIMIDCVRPRKETWLTNFSINASTAQFKLLDNQDAEVIYDSPQIIDSKRGITTTIITTVKVDQEEKERLIYLAYAGAIGFGAAYLAGGLFCKTAAPNEIYTCLQNEKRELIKINFDVRGNSDPAELKKWLKNQNVNELIITYYDSKSRLHEFINDNIKIAEPTSEKPTSIGLWSVFSMIGIPLVKKKLGEDITYCDDILWDNFKDNSLICGIGLDQNATNGIDFTNSLGFTQQSFDNLATKYKFLFPSYHKDTTSGKIDPTNEKFTGVVFRNMPLMFQVPTTKVEALQQMLDIVNKNLYLEFGWRDDRGFSWIAKIPEVVTSNPNYKGLKIFNNKIVQLKISKIEILGQESKLIKFALEDMSIGLIRTSTNPDKFKFEIEADAYLTLNEKGIDSFKIIPKDTSKKKIFDIKDTIPGFDYMRISKFETNFQQLFATVELFPDDALVEALPIFEKFSTDDPRFNPSHVLKSVIAFDLKTGTGVISIFLNTTKNTKAFGKWPLGVKAINIFINSPNGNRVEIIGEFNLGMKNFAKIGGKIVISHITTGWDFDIQLDQIGGSLAISDDLKIEGLLKWGTTYPPSYYDDPQELPREPLKSNNISEGKDRPFMAILRVKAPQMFGDFEIFAKIASKNGVPYNVFGLRLGQELNLGIGKLKEPELLITKNADTADEAIKNIVLNGAFSGIEKLRNAGDFNDRIKWLEGFKYSDVTGMTLVASGKLQYGTITEDPTHLTSILFSSSGLLRIEGWFKILGMAEEVQIVFAIDFVNKRLLVGFQLPSFKYPTPANPTLIFQPGQVFIGTSFGGDPYFLFSLGWPPQTGGSSYERDWSKANKAVWNPPTPPLPNMVAAGAMYELDAKKGFLLFGAALKAGWQFDVNFGIGKAGLEIGLGGVLVIKFIFKSAKYELFETKIQNPFPDKYLNINSIPDQAHLKKSKAYRSIYSSYLEIQHDLQETRLNIAVLGEVFADIKGYATVGIFGVTLAGVYLNAFARMGVCGSTDHGITRMGGSFGAEFCVRIGCVTYCKSAQIDIDIISGQCEVATQNYRILPQSKN